MRGKLFTQDYLEEGIAETAAWRGLGQDEVARAGERLAALFEAFPVAGTPNEAVTEADLIHPVLEALGWEDTLPQQTTSGRGRVDVPDVLLFPDAAAKSNAQGEKQEQRRYRHGVAIVESKRWGRKLDLAEAATAPDAGAPSTQMLRYLSRAETASHDRIRWGILTNGRHWRLYYQGARSRSEEFLELSWASRTSRSGLVPTVEAPPSPPTATRTPTTTRSGAATISGSSSSSSAAGPSCRTRPTPRAGASTSRPWTRAAAGRSGFPPTWAPSSSSGSSRTSSLHSSSTTRSAPSPSPPPTWTRSAGPA